MQSTGLRMKDRDKEISIKYKFKVPRGCQIHSVRMSLILDGKK